MQLHRLIPQITTSVYFVSIDFFFFLLLWWLVSDIMILVPVTRVALSQAFSCTSSCVRSLDTVGCLWHWFSVGNIKRNNNHVWTTIETHITNVVGQRNIFVGLVLEEEELSLVYRDNPSDTLRFCAAVEGIGLRRRRALGLRRCRAKALRRRVPVFSVHAIPLSLYLYLYTPLQ